MVDRRNNWHPRAVHEQHSVPEGLVVERCPGAQRLADSQAGDGRRLNVSGSGNEPAHRKEFVDVNRRSEFPQLGNSGTGLARDTGRGSAPLLETDLRRARGNGGPLITFDVMPKRSQLARQVANVDALTTAMGFAAVRKQGNPKWTVSGCGSASLTLG